MSPDNHGWLEILLVQMKKRKYGVDIGCIKTADFNWTIFCEVIEVMFKYEDKRIENAVIRASEKIVIQDKQMICSLLDSIYESTKGSEDS